MLPEAGSNCKSFGAKKRAEAPVAFTYPELLLPAMLVTAPAGEIFIT